MGDRIRVGLHYCGGCNAHYDRVALARRLEARFPGLRFTLAEPHTPYPALVVVCGCPARCTDVSRFTVSADRLIYLSSADDYLPACLRLSALLPGENPR